MAAWQHASQASRPTTARALKVLSLLANASALAATSCFDKFIKVEHLIVECDGQHG